MDTKEEDELLSLRSALAHKVFSRTASYDAAISEFLKNHNQIVPDIDSISGFPKKLTLSSLKSMPLRYGENPHQKLPCMENFWNISNNYRAKN